MQEDIAFLRAILNRPDDDGLRLVYADWLEERGDPRAEFVRLDVERYRLAKDDGKRAAALETRRRELQLKLDAVWVARMDSARSLPAGARLDLVFQKDGKALIEVRGQAETVLLVEGKPVALNWDDCAGSVGQYLVFTGHTCGSEFVRRLTELVAGNLDDRRPLAEQIEPLLALFVPGVYCLVYTPSTAITGLMTLEYSGRPADGELVEYYPFEERILVCTQTRAALHEDRVTHFRERIRAGERPIVITTSADGAWCEFVIDGHHKLAAYDREHVKPAVLGIVRSPAPAIGLEEGLSFLPRGHRGIAAYRRMKGLTVK